jgi:hypothetical protein
MSGRAFAEAFLSGDGRGGSDVTLMARPLEVLLPLVERLQTAAP